MLENHIQASIKLSTK